MGRRRAQKSQSFAKKLGEAYAEEFTQIFIEKFILRFAERFAERFTDGIAKKVAEILTPERPAAVAKARATVKRVVEAEIPTAEPESDAEDDEEPASLNLDPTNIAFRPRKDKSAAEISNELVVSVTEQFVKEFQQQLDTLRKNIAAFPNPPLLLPPPVSSIEMFPPPPVHDGTTSTVVDYDENDVATEKRLKQLNIYHKQQLLEVDQIIKYEHAVVDNDYDEWHDEISSALKRASYNHLKSIESYTVKLGYSPYGEGAEEKCTSAILEFQEAQLPCRNSF